jgi:beta-N-acetylhexosaminidase
VKQKEFFICLVIGFLFFWSCAEKQKQFFPAGLMASHVEAKNWAEKTLQNLTLRQKIGQMICEQIRGEYVAEDDPDYQYWLKLVKDYNIGGFVLYGGTPHDTARLLNRLQEASKIPLLISADFEGGPGQQIRGATEFPANMALSAIGSEELAYQVGKTGAAEGRALGIHLTYSPVVDIQTRPENPVLSVRSFGGDLELLGKMAGAYIRGYQENGMLATAKHYPGRGDVEYIPGSKFTINKKPPARVMNEDLLAFRKAIEAGVAFVMSEHIAIPSLTNGSYLPASVEKVLASSWLRDKLGFKGVLTTDDMWYQKVVDRFGPVKACIMAIQAGHDIILKPADVVATIQGIERAVDEGVLSEARIDQSVKRILYWKARLNLHRQKFVDEKKISAIVGIDEHRRLCQTIAELSLTLIKNDGFFSTDPARVGKVLHVSVQKKKFDQVPLVVSSKLKKAFDVQGDIFLMPDVDSRLYERALSMARQVDTVIISLFNQRTVYLDNGPLREEDLQFINEIIKIKPSSTVIMSYGNPYLAESLKKATAFLTGYGEGGFYGNQIVYADAFIKLLKGEITPRGRLPVKVSENFPLGTGIVY